VDAMEEIGGGTLVVRTAREGANAVVQFSDTGPGIREPGRVFDPFYTTKPVGKGTGLGLSICYGIIQEHGGEISCFNRPEGGATFRVELPTLPANFPQPATPFLITKKAS
jgi:signal transduction histidine kinase